MTARYPTRIAVTGMNARPDNPGPGVAVARCLREAKNFDGHIVGLGYEALDPGLYLPRYCDAAYLLPYPSSGDAAILERLVEIAEQEQIDALIPCLDAELPSICRLKEALDDMGISTFVPDLEQLTLRNKDRLKELAGARRHRQSRNEGDYECRLLSRSEKGRLGLPNGSQGNFLRRGRR